jgi:hypothetical protein
LVLSQPKFLRGLFFGFFFGFFSDFCGIFPDVFRTFSALFSNFSGDGFFFGLPIFLEMSTSRANELEDGQMMAAHEMVIWYCSNWEITVFCAQVMRRSGLFTAFHGSDWPGYAAFSLSVSGKL